VSLTWRTTSPCSEITTCGRYALQLYRREAMPGNAPLFTTRAYRCPPADAKPGTLSTVLGVTSNRDREIALRTARQLCEDDAAGAAPSSTTTGA
jgi:hypothetical protein